MLGKIFGPKNEYAVEENFIMRSIPQWAVFAF
jgi:hypothetical protein